MTAVRILDEPKQEQPLPRRHVADARRDRFRKRYGLMLIGVFALAAYTMLTCCLTGTIVHHNTKKQTWAEAKAYYDSKLDAYKTEQAQAEQAAYWLSGDASLEAQINRDADFLSRVDIWTTDEAYQTFVCNVWVRVLRDDYPGSVEEVLQQPKQYDFFSLKKPIDERRQAMTVELLRKLRSGVFPANLTMDHAWLEMKKDGAVCILHSSDKYYSTNDVPWQFS